MNNEGRFMEKKNFINISWNLNVTTRLNDSLTMSLLLLLSQRYMYCFRWQR